MKCCHFLLQRSRSGDFSLNACYISQRTITRYKASTGKKITGRGKACKLSVSLRSHRTQAGSGNLCKGQFVL